MQIYFLPPPLWPPPTLFASRFPLLPPSMPEQSRVGGDGRGQPAGDLEQSATVGGGALAAGTRGLLPTAGCSLLVSEVTYEEETTGCDPSAPVWAGIRGKREGRCLSFAVH